MGEFFCLFFLLPYVLFGLLISNMSGVINVEQGHVLQGELAMLIM